MTTSLIPFHNGQLEAVQHTDGKVYVNVRRICEHLGIALQSQAAKLHDARWAVVTMIVTTGFDGKSYNMLFLEASCLAFWMATLNPKKVDPELKELIEAYQVEARDVLARHFTPQVAPQPADADPFVQQLQVMLAIRQAQILQEQAVKRLSEEVMTVSKRKPVMLKTYTQSYKTLQRCLHACIMNAGIGKDGVISLNRQLKAKTQRARENYEFEHYVIAVNELQKREIDCDDLIDLMSSSRQ